MQNPVNATFRALSNQLAHDNRRVSRFLDGLAGRIDALVDAAKDKDWNEVRRVSDFIGRTSQIYGHEELADTAMQVCKAMESPMDELQVRKSLVKLISLYGRSETPGPQQHS